MRVFIIAFALALTMFPGAPAAAQGHGGDIELTVEDGIIVTNGGSGPLRVFLSEFGEVFPDFASEPGFDTEPGTFPEQTEIGFNIVDAVRIWDGESFEAVAPAMISVELGALGPALSPSEPDGFSAGFTLPVQSGGLWHRHYDYVLGTPATAGIYLLKLELFHTGGIGTSLPFYIVFNQGSSETAHDEAYEFVLGTLLSSPGVFGDVNGDGVVNASDLGLLLGAWGTDVAASDLNDDGMVNASDLALLLGAWPGS